MGSLAKNAKASTTPDVGLRHHLATLEAVGLPLQQLLLQAERGRMPVPDLIDWTEGYLERRDHPHLDGDATVLVFGCIRGWKPLLPAVKDLGLTLWEAILLQNQIRAKHLAEALHDDAFGPEFRARVLRRLGIPTCLTTSLRFKVNSPSRLRKVMSWLGADGPLLGVEVEIRGFQATSTTWGPLLAHRLELWDGTSPSTLEWRDGLTDPYCWKRSDELHLRRVRGLQHLRGITRGLVSFRDCPDLETLDGPARSLEVVDCPNLAQAWLGTLTHHLELKGCRSLRAIKPWTAGYDRSAGPVSDRLYELKDLRIQDCPSLRSLPPRLRILNGLHLQGVGPITDWPWDFRIEGSVLIEDCPGLECLPTMEIGGSLIVRGESGLRRLSAGTQISKHLDLRACSQLEGIPRGVKVRGNIYLPSHLNHRRRPAPPRVSGTGEPPEQLAPDLFENVRFVLLAQRFDELIPAEERTEYRKHGELLLARFRKQVVKDQRFEAHLLLAASEAWRDLTEEVWATPGHWTGLGDAGVEEDLPWVWFLELVRNA